MSTKHTTDSDDAQSQTQKKNAKHFTHTGNLLPEKKNEINAAREKMLRKGVK